MTDVKEKPIATVSFRLADGDWYTKRIREEWGSGNFLRAIDLAECVEEITKDQIKSVITGQLKIIINGNECFIENDNADPKDYFQYYLEPVISNNRIDARASLDSAIVDFMSKNTYFKDDFDAEDFLEFVENSDSKPSKSTLEKIKAFCQKKSDFHKEQMLVEGRVLSGIRETYGIYDDKDDKDGEQFEKDQDQDPFGLKASLMQKAKLAGCQPDFLDSINLAHDYMMGIKHNNPDLPAEHSLNGVIDLNGEYHICEYMGHSDLAKSKFDCTHDDLVKKGWVDVKKGKFSCIKKPNTKQKNKIFDICEYHKYDYDEKMKHLSIENYTEEEA